MKEHFKVNDSYLIKRIGSHPRSLFSVLLTISLLELFFLIRGLVVFNFDNPRHIIYEISYGALLLISIAGGIYVLLTMKNSMRFQKQYYFLTIVYEALIIAFSTTISCLDIMVEGGQTIVYVTTILAIPMLALINPYIYSIFGVISTATLLLVSHYRGGIHFSNGEIINYAVLDILVIFACFSLYRLYKLYYEKEIRLNTLSLTDQLTGLYNRRKLDQDMKDRSDSSPKEPYAFIFCDIDDFKAVNDSRGHSFGDDVLAQVGLLLKNQFGNGTYRYGGDEFAIVTSKSRQEIVISIGLIQERLSLFSSSTQLTLSFGVYESDGNDNGLVPFRMADKALYATKAQGKSSYTFCKELKPEAENKEMK